MRTIFLAAAAVIASTPGAAGPIRAGGMPVANPQPAAAAPRSHVARVVSPVPSVCERTGSYANGEDRRPQTKRLGELPPAETYMAVYRTDERGCLDPLLARDLRRPARQR